MTRPSILPHLLLFICCVRGAAAQTVSFGGEIRERSEVSGKSLSAGAVPDVFHLLRTRLAAVATIDEHISGRVELQDARLFGETRTTQNLGAPALDLRQAYIDLSKIGGTTIGLRLGRQVISYANERLISRSDWGNTGQSFDGIVASATMGDLKVDAFGAAVARLGTESHYERDVFLAGLWGAWSPDSNRTSLQAYYLFDDPHSGTIARNRHTAGIYARGAAGPVDAELDGALQMGTEAGPLGSRKIAASLVGVRLGYTLDLPLTPRLGLVYDRISGDPGDGSTDRGEFSLLYGTTHKFYGLIDYFPPMSGYGLQDLAVVIDAKASASLALCLEVHGFLTATAPAKLGSTASSRIGRELDLVGTYKPATALALQGGIAVFDGAPERPLLLGRATTTWGYLMATLTF